MFQLEEGICYPLDSLGYETFYRESDLMQQTIQEASAIVQSTTSSKMMTQMDDIIVQGWGKER